MKTNFCIKRWLVAVIVVAFVTLSSVGTVFAAVQTIEADGYYIIGDGPDENHSVAKNRARMDAKRFAAEKAGVFVESLTEVKNGQLTKDEINTISAQVLQIESEKITPEIIGETIRYCCHIVAKVDSSNLTEKLNQDRQKLYEAVKQNKYQQQELDAVKKELAELKERYKTADENHRQEINSEINKNESRFTAVEWAQKGLDYYYLGNNQKAIECFQRAAQLNPDHDATWNNLGNAYTFIGNKQKGIECFQKALQINPNNYAAWNNLGVAYYFLSDKQKARDCFQRAIQINPNYVDARNNLSKL